YLAAHPGNHYGVGGPACRADPSATCVAGADRYTTSVDLAQRLFQSPPAAGLASAASFPDALSGGAAAARSGGPLILVPPRGSLPPPLASYLSSTRSLTGATVYGGDAAVAPEVLSEIG
ncbi:MAG: cell wall-binding repeat-containing protein, partial [Acidimicrobiales bacterium]